MRIVCVPGTQTILTNPYGSFFDTERECPLGGGNYH